MADDVSPSLQVRAHPFKRRALHATQTFEAGQAIHLFRSPLILHPTLAALASRCAYCLRASNPRACSRCRAAFYCNASCQQAGWTALHSKECKALRARNTRGGGGGRSAAELPTPVRVLVQALLKKEIEEGLASLEGHVEQRMKTRSTSSSRHGGGRNSSSSNSSGDAREWADLEMMAMAACAYAYGKPPEERDVRKAIDLLCKIHTNAFYRFDEDEGGQVGMFLEPTLAMANHSCIPNATVLFMQREALLLAERPIQAGDEIEISYTDYTSPLSSRKRALASYRFECQCARCTNDLNVYQVAAQSPDTTLDALSVLGSKAPRHPGATDASKIQVAARNSAEVDYGDSLCDKHLLRTSLQKYRPLIDGELWAISPLPNTLSEVSIYYAQQQQDYPRAVAVAALVAVECNPYRYTAPFHSARLRNLLVIAKLLVLTAETSVALRQSLRIMASGAGLNDRIHDTLDRIDQVSLSQMLLTLVLMMVPAGCRDAWELGSTARELLDDIDRLQGREQELGLINAWKKNPKSEESRGFFDYAVVQQIKALASLGRAVLKADFGV